MKIRWGVVVGCVVVLAVLGIFLQAAEAWSPCPIEGGVELDAATALTAITESGPTIVDGPADRNPDPPQGCPDPGLSGTGVAGQPYLVDMGGSPSPSVARLQSWGGSLIDNYTMTHLHTAWDYTAPAPVAHSGCSSCGGGGPQNPLPQLAIQRIHRYRDLDVYSSFGPGIFSNYDSKLYIYELPDSAGTRVDIFDPQLVAPVRTFDGAYGDTKDGIAVDPQFGRVKQVQFFDDSYTPCNDPEVGGYAVVTSHQDENWEYELIDLDPTEAPEGAPL